MNTVMKTKQVTAQEGFKHYFNLSLGKIACIFSSILLGMYLMNAYPAIQGIDMFGMIAVGTLAYVAILIAARIITGLMVGAATYGKSTLRRMIFGPLTILMLISIAGSILALPVLIPLLMSSIYGLESAPLLKNVGVAIAIGIAAVLIASILTALANKLVPSFQIKANQIKANGADRKKSKFSIMITSIIICAATIALTMLIASSAFGYGTDITQIFNSANAEQGLIFASVLIGVSGLALLISLYKSTASLFSAKNEDIRIPNPEALKALALKALSTSQDGRPGHDDGQEGSYDGRDIDGSTAS
jgi:MFS family permease